MFLNYNYILCDLHSILEPHQIQFRSYEEQLKILEDPNYGKKSFADYGYSHKPMLLEIPHTDFMMCDLHILWRILFNLLLRELAQIDKKVDSEKFNEKKHINLKKLFDFLKTINIQIDIDVNIDINQMFGRYLKKSDTINRLWKDFFNIY